MIDTVIIVIGVTGAFILGCILSTESKEKKGMNRMVKGLGVCAHCVYGSGTVCTWWPSIPKIDGWNYCTMFKREGKEGK